MKNETIIDFSSKFLSRSYTPLNFGHKRLRYRYMDVLLYLSVNQGKKRTNDAND